MKADAADAFIRTPLISSALEGLVKTGELDTLAKIIPEILSTPERIAPSAQVTVTIAPGATTALGPPANSIKTLVKAHVPDGIVHALLFCEPSKKTLVGPGLLLTAETTSAQVKKTFS